MRVSSQHIRSVKRPLTKAALLLLLLLPLFYSQAQQPSATNQAKAVFLFNFTHFVTWPATAFFGNSPFVIGVLGDDPFGTYLEKVVEGQKVDGRPVVIRRYKEVNEIKNCHILFINKADPAAIIPALTAPGVLTVSDKKNFVQNGGIIGFYQEDNKIRLQINSKAAKAANISISSKLLRLADVIDQ